MSSHISSSAAALTNSFNINTSLALEKNLLEHHRLNSCNILESVSIAGSLVFSGLLQQNEVGFTYVKVDDRLHTKLEPLLVNAGFTIPNFYGKGGVGAHISVYTRKESQEKKFILDLSELVAYTIIKVDVVRTKVLGKECFLAILNVNCEKLRKIKPDGDFYITVGIKENDEKRVNQSKIAQLKTRIQKLKLDWVYYSNKINQGRDDRHWCNGDYPDALEDHLSNISKLIKVNAFIFECEVDILKINYTTFLAESNIGMAISLGLSIITEGVKLCKVAAKQIQDLSKMKSSSINEADKIDHDNEFDLVIDGNKVHRQKTLKLAEFSYQSNGKWIETILPVVTKRVEQSKHDLIRS